MKSRIDEKPLVGYPRLRPHRDKGASSVEYAVLGSLIAVAIFLVVMNLGNQVRLLFETIVKAW